jgi:glycosyl transferase family 87
VLRSAAEWVRPHAGSLHDGSLPVRRWAGSVALLGAVAFLAWKVSTFESTGWLALDFKLDAARRLVDGQTLYPPGATGGYPYPPIWAILASPLLLLPTGAAPYVACASCAGAFVAALWIVGLRDPLCYAAALVSGPIVSVTQIGNASAFVTLLLALAYRLNAAPAGLAVAIKLYAWPVLLWSATQRGLRDLCLGVGVVVTAILVPWAALGFDGIERYVSVVRAVTANQSAYALPTATGVTLAMLALVAMWIRRTDPVGSFSFSILAMLAATPVLWGFYFSTVFLALALRRPRFSIAWLVPFLAVTVQSHGYAIVFLALLAWCGVGAPTARSLRPETAGQHLETERETVLDRD